MHQTPRPAGSTAGPTRTERLDGLPFNTQHRKLLVGSGVGWALDAMDVGLVSFVMAALAQQWGLGAGQLSLLASIGFVGMAVGAGLGGLLADRIGRRQVFALTLLVYGLATGASALVGTLAALVALRFVVGLGLGAELPVASTLVSEYAPRRIRGRLVVILESFWAVGWILAALVGYFVVPSSEEGWRWALAIGVLPALYAVVVRRALPESVRFLEGAGRADEAEEAVRAFERARPLGGGRSEAAEEPPSAAPDAAEGARGIWSAALRRRTAALWTVWFCINFAYYGAFTWLPTLLVQQGFTLTRSFGYVLIITLAQLPGYAVAAWLIEVWGRRITLAVFLAGSAVSAVLFGIASMGTVVIAWQVIGAGMALSFFNLGAWGALYAIGPELYPTSVRGTGTGAAAAFGRVASILAPLSVPLLLRLGGERYDLIAVFAAFGAAFLLAALATFAMPEQRGRALR
ncbi:MFS transporter [Kocuria dechangensis]|uniref:MFS transporter n=1 Tax=Kocuria dechangensis TaxID=1176249 RepID=A0A917LR45_9MICC|nr:MFS transporter [Kocuria dechangensis]GGG50482.1 MFS transporter [Kocuria dechangensis]